ncbi:MAG: galactokinase [bacterium]
MHNLLVNRLRGEFVQWLGVAPAILAYAPGRIEVLGNHTDYNEGHVLSAAIDYGIAMAVAPIEGPECRLAALDLNGEARFPAANPDHAQTPGWANYLRGVYANMLARGGRPRAFAAAFRGTLPQGAGLSSSAALEMSTGLALARLLEVQITTLEMAKIGQAAEHDYAGVKCGLLDQISSLCGRAGMLVRSDFRTLEVCHEPLNEGAVFLVANTAVKHNLVESAYNERREKCEEAARFFASVLPHPVRALRDVTWSEWQEWSPRMEPCAARRAAHVVGENTRVVAGSAMLERGDLAGFGQLMFDSHASSRAYFENSCPELDTLVTAARTLPGVYGARLSGGGFGGSVVVLVRAEAAPDAAARLSAVYAQAYGHACDTIQVLPSAGASLFE